MLIIIQVAERALYFWNNEYFCNLVSDNVEVILPIMFAPLYESSTGHWNRYGSQDFQEHRHQLTYRRTIHGMVYNAMKLFMEVNPRLFDECSHEYTESQNNADQRLLDRQAKWDRLTELAQKMKSGTASTTAGVVAPDAQAIETDPLRLEQLKLQDDATAAAPISSVR